MSVLPDTAVVEDGRLCVGGTALADLAREHGTPLHVYDEATLRARARAYREALAAYPGSARAVYACKANATVGLLRVLVQEGMGMDVASEGELAHALAAGAPPEGLVVHGNNKSDDDVRAAVAAGAGLLVVDHLEELDQVDGIAAAEGREQPVLLRATPGIEADTHAKIQTGHAASKFGMAPGDLERAIARAAACRHLRLDGLHVHLGSQIRDLGTYLAAVEWLARFEPAARLPVLDLGGGLAIPYTDEDDVPDLDAAVTATATAVAGRFDPLPELVLEPGRSVVGTCGVTLYTVGAVKRTAAGITYVAVDGGMSDNPRPVLYGARYQAWIADRADAEPDGAYAVAGKHCESGDVLIERAPLPAPRPGDVLVVAATGAYAASMASTYNALPRAAAVLVAAGGARTIVRRETVGDLLALQV
ncbi:MAG TPA: diaminopimelate decarboxylase [Gaiellales bacterium]|nr:diaminopimelate decarboxylase [Gaiellales bacterium]